MSAPKDSLYSVYTTEQGDIKIPTSFEELDYYTIWSNILFYIVMIWLIIGYLLKKYSPPFWFTSAAITNMIAVGIIGSLLVSIYTDKIVSYLNSNGYSIDSGIDAASNINLYTHQIPMIIAIIIMLFIKKEKFEFSTSMLFLISFAFIWMAIPHSGDKTVFIGKINEDYMDPNLILIALLPILWFIFLTYFQRETT
jgi:hypothetical protein